MKSLVLTRMTARFAVTALFAYCLALPEQARAAKPNCDTDPSHSSCGGDTQAQTPAKIIFDDSQSGIRSDDGTPYEGFPNPTGLEVFIGSQANFGNIFLRTNTTTAPSARRLDMTLSENTCGLPTVPTLYDFHFANAKVDNEVPDGLFGIADSDPPQNSPMTIRFFHGGAAYFLTFDSTNKGPCSGVTDFIKIDRLSGTTWRVYTEGQVACVERHNPKGKNDFRGTGPANFSYTIEDISGQ